MAKGNGYAWFHLVIMKDTCKGRSCISLAAVNDDLKISPNVVLQFSCLISVCITWTRQFRIFKPWSGFLQKWYNYCHNRISFKHLCIYIFNCVELVSVFLKHDISVLFCISYEYWFKLLARVAHLKWQSNLILSYWGMFQRYLFWIFGHFAFPMIYYCMI